MVRDKLLLEPLLGLSRWLLDLLLDELRSLKGQPGSLLLRLKVRSGHDDLLQLDWLLDAGRDVCLLGLLEDLSGRTAGHRDGNLVDYLLRSDDVFRLLLLLTTIRFQLDDLILNLLKQLMLLLLLLTTVCFQLYNLVLNLLKQLLLVLLLLLLLVMIGQQLSLRRHRKGIAAGHALDYPCQIVTSRGGHHVHLLAIVAFDFDPGDQLAGGGTTLVRYPRDGRSLRFQHRSDVLDL